MSFLKIKDHNKRDETVKEFLALKNKIKDNFRKERLGEIETQRDLAKLFKPVTETQIATTKDGKFYIGTKEVEIKGDNIIIENKSYQGSPGLWELIVAKNPNVGLYTPVDYKNYKRILIQTDAMRSEKKPNSPKSNKGTKWKNVVKLIWEGQKKPKGKGLTVIPSDPNALLERLDLLLASQAAGHTGVGNELTSICDELKRQGVINADAYKKINSLIKI